MQCLYLGHFISYVLNHIKTLLLTHSRMVRILKFESFSEDFTFYNPNHPRIWHVTVQAMF